MGIIIQTGCFILLVSIILPKEIFSSYSENNAPSNRGVESKRKLWDSNQKIFNYKDQVDNQKRKYKKKLREFYIV